MADPPNTSKLTKEQRELRDNLILRLFLSGWTEREIAKHQRIALTHGRVHQIIEAQLEIAGERFGLISKKALVVYSERLEMLIRAIWPSATGPDKDTKAIEVARRLLEQQSRLYNIGDESLGMGGIPPMGDNELADDVTDLQRWRERHRKPPEVM
jgi:hypothetical protein